ncbi:hypothetical protein [Bifidobacterium mongoliense]|jgi:ElaB/YqjD/DUF883 family membrane-anchored ribosome-binding protein|uniref:hypothetical protein n=1 Tax=Bifidobacterium mongoliense TaxID=518643 RepID=UPI0026483656|nr:hypothetical protein [Bifidobacterium mongoliense]MDN5979652.1 hypothetical protein [Bifidobacterium mongoliense]MDN6769501.1 hypothetical protein [Bifidobacterium mongoliense]MDN6783608.1 hypothetical protein [Bifidobacterium mongoliense]
MAENIDTVSAQIVDLEKLMTQRFDSVEKRLDGLESQEVHESDIKHVNRRIDDLKQSTDSDHDDLKVSIDDIRGMVWKAVGATGTIVGLIVGLLEWAIPLIMR